MKPTNPNKPEAQYISNNFDDESDVDDLINSDEAEPSPETKQQQLVQAPTSSTEIIMLSSGTIHVGSICLPVDRIASLLLELLRDEQVQKIIHGSETKSSKDGYVG